MTLIHVDRVAARSPRRDGPGRLLPLSLVLHGAALVLLFLNPPRRPPEPGTEPLSVEIVPDAGLAAPALMPAEVAAEPAVAEVPAQPAETPPPPFVDAPPVAVPAPLPSLAIAPQAELPVPLPVTTPIPLPPVPPPLAVTPPATPPVTPPLPSPSPSPPRPVARPRPAPAPVQRPTARPAARTPTDAAADTAGSAAIGTNGAGSAARANATASAGANGSAWLGRLKQWWDGHSFYPREASQTDEGGAVRVRIAIAPDGQVTSVQVVVSSGSPVLDAAALAVFRGVRLPAPSEAVAGPAEVVVTLHYRSAGGGG